jgi:glutamate-1-semialdehyde 2,1-aminomutase
MTNVEAFTKAKQVFPGGVNSPVRSFNAVGGSPFFTARAKGCCLYDVENNRYIDYICSWGANIVGHANPYVVEKMTAALHNGFSFGTPTELETALANKIISLMPTIEKIRLVSSGTEAAMSAIRVARGFTQRNIIIKFSGCYHGHVDGLLVSGGSGLATFINSQNPSSGGVSKNAIFDTMILPYNDVALLEEAFCKFGEQIAGVIIEPFAGNMNLIRPSNQFITKLRELCTKAESVLIFDEVMTGFRVALGGSEELLGIKPDLVVLGKVIGGGMPLAAFGGKKEIMDVLSPLGSVYQAGTLSGNPIAVTCGLATLELVTADGFYSKLTANTKYLVEGMKDLAKKNNIEFNADTVGGMFGFYFSNEIPQNFVQMEKLDKNRFNKFFHAMLACGVYFAPSMFEAGFVCSSHDTNILDETLNIMDKVFKKL